MITEMNVSVIVRMSATVEEMSATVEKLNMFEKIQDQRFSFITLHRLPLMIYGTTCKNPIRI